MTKGGREFWIVQDTQTSLWYVKTSGKSPPMFVGAFTKFAEAESSLIRYLKNRDFWKKAIYPGCPAQNPLRKSTEPLSKD